MKKLASVLLSLSLMISYTVFAADETPQKIAASDDENAAFEMALPSEDTSVPTEAQTAPSEAPSSPTEDQAARPDSVSSPTEPDTASFSSEPETAPSEDSTDAPLSDSVSKEPISAPDIAFEWINLYVDDSFVLTKNRIFRIDGEIFLPAAETASLLKIEAEDEKRDDYGTLFVALTSGKTSALFFENSRYAFVNWEKTELEGISRVIDGKIYIPQSALFSIFGVRCEEKHESADTDFYIYSPVSEMQRSFEDVVNSRRIASKTDYLIWVSKANYSVRLFKKSPSGWKFVKEFPCAIGAPNTPTCEGVYKYYERVTAWYYNKYYVGPVMRFNGGYAIHSTLTKYDETPYDNRVGVKISHGCVRLLPADIRYLSDTVPLYTTVYVTAE